MLSMRQLTKEPIGKPLAKRFSILTRLLASVYLESRFLTKTAPTFDQTFRR